MFFTYLLGSYPSMTTKSRKRAKSRPNKDICSLPVAPKYVFFGVHLFLFQLLIDVFYYFILTLLWQRNRTNECQTKTSVIWLPSIFFAFFVSFPTTNWCFYIFIRFLAFYDNEIAQTGEFVVKRRHPVFDAQVCFFYFFLFLFWLLIEVFYLIGS